MDQVRKDPSAYEAVVLRWSRHPRCVGQARTELRKALANWGLLAIEDSALLVLSELLTNAGQHAHVPAGREIETRYVRVGDGVRIEVHDASNERPEPREPDTDACDGRGMALIAALADRWAVEERVGPGKVIWAELTLPEPGSHRDDS